MTLPPERPEERRERLSELDRTIISLPLIERIEAMAAQGRGGEPVHVIIDTNLLYKDGRKGARAQIRAWIEKMVAQGEGALDSAKNEHSQQYVFAQLTAKQIRDLARRDIEEHRGQRAANEEGPPSPARAIHRIWLDHEIEMWINKSVSTVKADAARNAFGAFGREIVWAVLDSGIDQKHPHFTKHKTLDLAPPLLHRDFTVGSADKALLRDAALRDPAGHGTHVAGIIAGQFRPAKEKGIVARIRRFEEDGAAGEEFDRTIPEMVAMAPEAKLLSLKVLDDRGAGRASNLIAAIEYIQDLNANGRHLLVHGVNMSVGYGFEPKWFACGQSPLCVEVNRLVRSGVVVVVAAGNTGYGHNQPLHAGPRAAGLDITINDPGNAELAITVGSTHRDMPHVYGVSFFSSKGPTGDGRRKPDLVAPGEKIISCASQDKPAQKPPPADAEAVYAEDSGTSMAAPHVSGVIASFLSVRREFIGEPLRVKEIFLATATDLDRAPYFQGRGLVDLMRAIQSV